MPGYDSALTTFAPDGSLYQVKYAFEAVQKGKAVVAVRGKNCIALGVERRVTAKLEDDSSEQKIANLDTHLLVGFSGLSADARVLIDRARVEAQSYRLTVEDKPSIEYMAKWVSSLQQKYTQRGGVRPFGVSIVIAGFSVEGEPMIYKTEPTGNYMAWRACAIGNKSEETNDFLKKEYKENMEKDQVVRMCVESLLQVVEEDRPIEIWVIEEGGPEGGKMLEKDVVDGYRKEIHELREKEREEREQAARS
eukprot:snap_masked-scaffold_1-processed-gene-2.13-mRNA-1 protein AED:0.33 eAED:0.33 QI:0/-1/0/1/-1/1/1/0/249